jgi:hypothetical protein
MNHLFCYNMVGVAKLRLEIHIVALVIVRCGLSFISKIKIDLLCYYYSEFLFFGLNLLKIIKII